MLRPFRDIVKECFPDVSRPVRDEDAVQKARIKSASWEKFTALAIEERAWLKTLSLSTVDAIAGDMMLSELIQAAGKNNLSSINALLSGYRYFLRALFLDGGRELIKASRELE